MHTIKLNISENIYEHVVGFLKNINPKDLQIIEESKKSASKEELKALFADRKEKIFKDIKNPLDWQQKQREAW